ncbi:MAG: bifunctional homocysteine S-methyltransferase/methylenetetrahydrofolate reductase [Acidobacteria bacterium]|nr:bifunctional homocysteine S-methyltransferase/methylenetetrahydrofolate reductase [Acidobacteriota bacterium]
MSRFRALLEDDRAHIFDGAMGTMLYAKGVYINRCFDELNISNPKMVLDVHKEYIKAGAEIIETNSFGANFIKLSKHGLEDKLFEINREAAKIAREAAGDKICVAAAIGPLGIRIEPYGPTSRDEAKEFFKKQIQALLDAKGAIDCFILETFSDLSEINQAIRAIKELSDLPIIAQMTIQPFGKTAFGTAPETFTTQLDSWGVDSIGINCNVGPQASLDAIQIMSTVTERKLSVQPNAGLPREVDGRKMYMCSPEYMAKYAKRFIQSGVKFIGGCCGTTPEHIRLIANAVKASSPQRVAVSVSTPREQTTKVEETPIRERSNFARKIVEGEFVTSVEIVPAKGCDATKMIESVKELRDAGVDAVNIPDGPRAQSRMGALTTAILIQQQISGIEPVVHYCCRDRNLLGMMSDLLGAAALGINNLLIITGDPPKMGPYPEATAVFDVDSIGLTNMVTSLNQGLDIGSNPIGKPTSFFIGVGVNPCAVDLDTEIRRFEWKVEAGAQFAVTQPIFDLDQFFYFLKRIEHCKIPIIVGIWPLVSYRNAEFLSNEVPGISVPPYILERMRNADGQEAARQEGLAIAREMLKEVKTIVKGVQVSAPFGRVPYALDVFSVLR